VDRAHAVLILLVEIVSICGEDVMSDVDASLQAAALQLCRSSQDPEQGAFQKKSVFSRVHVV
jgi:hypothetical protein